MPLGCKQSSKHSNMWEVLDSTELCSGKEKKVSWQFSWCPTESYTFLEAGCWEMKSIVD